MTQGNIETRHLEFSKVIVNRTLAIFLAHTVLTLLVVFFQSGVASHAVNLMTAVVPLYIVIFGGYFGKAGLENYNKIRYWEQPEPECESEPNG